MTITKETIKQFMKEKGYKKIIFSPKGSWEIWTSDVNFDKNDWSAPWDASEELPHDNFVNYTYWTGSGAAAFYGVSGTYKSFISEIKETDTDFLTELFKWARQEKVKKIETEQETEPEPNSHIKIGGSVKEVIIQKKTQEDYQRDDKVIKQKLSKIIEFPSYKCSCCGNSVNITEIALNEDLYNKPEERKFQIEKRCYQHLENCSLCSAEMKIVAKGMREWAEGKINELNNNNPNHRERERERERAFWFISNGTASNPSPYKVII